MGTTTHDATLPPFAVFDSGESEGARTDRLIGTYLHGVFEHSAVCAEVFGVDCAREPSKAEHYGRLAEWFATHLRCPAAMELR
jgi:cobyric acid synthase